MDISLEREVLVAIIDDVDKLHEVLPILKPAHISAPHLRWTLKKLFIYYNKYGEKPPLHYFKNQLKKDKTLEPDDKERYGRLIAKLYKKSTRAGRKRYAIDELREFISKREITRIIETSLDHLEKDDIEKTVSELQAVGKVRAFKDDYKISNWLESWELRQTTRKERKENPERSDVIKFPWAGMNRAIGGIQPGECGCIASLTSVGKSITLILFGKRAFLDDKKVAHFVTENSLWQTEQRYDSALLGIDYDKLKYYNFTKKELKELSNLVKQVREHRSNNLRIVKLQPRMSSIITMERALYDLERDGFVPHFIVLDSADHLLSASNVREYRLDQAEVYWNIKTISDTYSLPLMTSTQVRQAEKGRIASAEALAEAYDKARILDIVLTLNQLTEDSPELVLKVAKNRDGKRGQEIYLVTEYGSMIIREKR